MKTMSPPAGVQTRPTETPGRLHALFHFPLGAVFRHAERFADHLGRDDELIALPSAMRRACLRIERGDFAFEIADAGLARVAVNDLVQAGIRELDLLADLEPVLGRLLGHQVLGGDMDLFQFRVAGKFDHFHPVAQRLGNRIHPVRRGDEQNLREIERRIEIVVPERGVLLRIEHFHQCRRRIAAEIAAEFIHLVQHEDGVVGFGAAQSLHDLPGQSADVRAPVAANLGFVVHSAERNAHELAAERARDGFPERSLAHARRPDEAKDRTLHPGLQLFHREVIQDALLDLLQIVVILDRGSRVLCECRFPRCPRIWPTATKSSTPDTSARPCTRPKPASSFAAASARARIPFSLRRTCPDSSSFSRSSSISAWPSSESPNSF